MTAWIFQGNPKRFRMNDYLRDFEDIKWTVAKPSLARLMQPGTSILPLR